MTSARQPVCRQLERASEAVRPSSRSSWWLGQSQCPGCARSPVVVRYSSRRPFPNRSTDRRRKTRRGSSSAGNSDFRRDTAATGKPEATRSSGSGTHRGPFRGGGSSIRVEAEHHICQVEQLAPTMVLQASGVGHPAHRRPDPDDERDERGPQPGGGRGHDESAPARPRTSRPWTAGPSQPTVETGT